MPDDRATWVGDEGVHDVSALDNVIDRGVVEQISRAKGEPEWMTETRLRALYCFDMLPMPDWLAVAMAETDFRDTSTFTSSASLQPGGEQVPEWDVADVADHRQRADLAEQGVLFCDMDRALREYPQLVEEYFGTIVPPGDSQFAALNTSVWSGGSFIYVPPGVDVEMPLQAYSRTDSASAGQFERTLIIAGEGSRVHFIEGCSAPIYTTDSLRAAVVEVVVQPHARVTHTTIQNWSPNVSDLVTARARVETGGHMTWIDGNIGSKLTMKRTAVHMVGDGASAEVLSVSHAGRGQHHDGSAEIVHGAPNTTSKIISKSISKDGGLTSSQSMVRVDDGATGAVIDVECAALILDEHSVSTILPRTEIGENDAQIGHDVSVSAIADEQLFYVLSRGLSEEQAMAMIVNGFIEPITAALPMEYAVEWSRLVELQMHDSVG